MIQTTPGLAETRARAHELWPRRADQFAHSQWRIRPALHGDIAKGLRLTTLNRPTAFAEAEYSSADPPWSYLATEGEENRSCDGTTLRAIPLSLSDHVPASTTTRLAISGSGAHSAPSDQQLLLESRQGQVVSVDSALLDREPRGASRAAFCFRFTGQKIAPGLSFRRSWSEPSKLGSTKVSHAATHL